METARLMVAPIETFTAQNHGPDFSYESPAPNVIPAYAPLYERLFRAGRLLEPEAWERCTLFDLNFRPELMSAGARESGFHALVDEIYRNDRVKSRRRKFWAGFRGGKIRVASRR